MEIEKIALFDLYLKSIPKYGLQNILNIDRLMILSPDQKDVLDLKNSAINLSHAKSYIRPDDLAAWESLLKEQIKFSVDRAKKLKSNQ